MANAITINTDSAGLARKLRAQLPRYPRAVAAGINRTAQSAYTLAVREIQKDIGASAQKTIRRNLTVTKASADKPQAKVVGFSSKRDRIPIYELQPRPRSVTRRRPVGGVSYGPRRKLIPGSFIARLTSGHIGVFKRMTPKRTPIDELSGPSVALVFSRKKIGAAIGAFIKEKLPVEIGRAFKAFGG